MSGVACILIGAAVGVIGGSFDVPLQATGSATFILCAFFVNPVGHP